MKKKITSMLLCLVMIFSMLSFAVPINAASVTSTQLTVTADKTTAAPGDTINYTITMGRVSDLGTIQMVLDIPDGLTYTLGSGKLAAGLKGKLGFDSLDYTESQKDGKTRVMINGVASSADYESATDTQIATFRCTVDAGATGKLSVGLTELEFISCQTFDDFTDRFSVVKADVTISGATPPPVTTYTVTFNANGGSGSMAAATGVPAGAYTLPNCAFFAPAGKRFVGWATTQKGTAMAAGTSFTVSGNVTLYAIWEDIPTTHPAKPTIYVTGTYTYNRSVQTATVAGFNSATMLISGNTGTNAGTYTVSVTSKSGRWADGTSTPVTATWSIGRKVVTPTIRVAGTYTYTGTPVEPTFTVEDGGAVISTSEYARTITDNNAVGTGKITISDKTGGNYEIVTTSQTFTIGAPTPPPTIYTSTQIKLTADKTAVKAGDVITYTITMGPVSDLGSIQMKLKLSTGLTVVAGSCKLTTGLKAKLGFDDISFTEGTDYVITGIASAANYRSDTDTVIATFKCKVGTGATGSLKVDLKDLEFYSVTFDDNTSRFSVVPATVAVSTVAITDALVPITGLTGKAYTGAVQEPSFGGTLVRNTDYKVTYKLKTAGAGSLDGGKPKGAGTYIVTVTGKGNYVGSFTKEFTIGKATPTYTIPSGIQGEYGKALSTITLPEGWSFKDSGTVMNAEGTHTYKAIFTPKDTTNYNVVENIDISVKVVKTDSRQKVNKVTATSNIADIVVLDGAKQFPSFTVTEGSPAYFSPTSGKWVKYNGTEWKEYTASTFTEGKYKLMVQVRIDYLGGDTHVLDKSGVTVTVDGNVWNADAPFVHSNYSYAWLTSGEFVVNKTVTTYTVSFNANGGTGTMANVTVSAGAYTLPANSFTAPAGKQFKGWATGATGAVIAGTTYHVADNVTFYAIWEDTPHTHNYGTDWHKSSEKHWRECSVCHEKKDEAAHIPGPNATETTAQTCTVCGYVIKPPLGHIHLTTLVNEVKPTCTEAGNIAYYKCSCSKLYYDAEATKEITNPADVVVAAKGHTCSSEWFASDLYHWHECTDCHSKQGEAEHVPGAAATETTPQNCIICGYVLNGPIGHTHSFDQKKTEAKYLKSPATCKAAAVYYYSCSCGAKGTETFVSGEKLAHNFRNEWSTDSSKHWHECSLCGEKREEAEHTFAWKVDKQATVTAAGANHEECTVCGYKKNAVVIDKLAPSITEGKDSTWNKNSQNGLIFKSDAAYTDFTQVLVDGEVIAADNYDKREGSIIVELKASYLATLSEGEHTLTIRSKSGDATAKFTVEAAESAKSTAWIWIVLAVVILGGGAAAVYVFVIRKRKTA